MDIGGVERFNRDFDFLLTFFADTTGMNGLTGLPNQAVLECSVAVEIPRDGDMDEMTAPGSC
jgi:hypothetical protein